MKTLLKKIIVLSLALMLFIPTMAMASDIRVVVNGEQVDFSGDQAPYIDAAGRTLLPIRKVFEKFGSDAKVDYDQATQMVTLHKGITHITLIIGNPYLTVMENGVSWNILMDTVPVLTENNRTMLPVRYVAEAMGAKVDWEPNTRTVFINLDYTVVDGYAGNAQLSMVSRDGKYGCIDKNGRVVIPIAYDSLEFTEFSETEKDSVSSNYNNVRLSMAKATQNNKVVYLGIILEHDDVKTASVDEYDYAESVPGNHNYIFVQKDGKWGILAMSGEKAVDIIYDEKPDLMTYNGDMRVRVKKDNLYGIYTLDNKEIAPIKYNMIGKVDFTAKGNPITYYQEGYVCAMRNTTFGYLDMEGREIGFQFLDTNPFRNGIAQVNYNGEDREIKIDSSGRITFLPKQDNGWD